jgi:hypothetical protein
MADLMEPSKEYFRHEHSSTSSCPFYSYKFESGRGKNCKQVGTLGVDIRYYTVYI